MYASHIINQPYRAQVHLLISTGFVPTSRCILNMVNFNAAVVLQ